MNLTPTSPQSVLHVHRHETVLRLTMHRPNAANALNQPLQAALVEAVQAAERDDTVGAIMLEGGSKVFSAGADLKEYTDIPRDEAMRRRREELRRTLIVIAEFAKPLVVAMQGHAVGAGCMLALLADELHAGTNAQFSMPEVRLGMVTPLAVSIAAEIGGAALVRHLVLSGRRLTAEDVARIGVVHAVHEPDALEAAGLARAKELAALDRRAYRHTKRWMNRGLIASIHEGVDESARLAELLAGE